MSRALGIDKPGKRRRQQVSAVSPGPGLMAAHAHLLSAVGAI
jgi:hypothetical protein